MSYGVNACAIPEKNGSCLEVRLNSPRGKFKITNMADDQVDPTPEALAFLKKRYKN